jgi:hypothetical protein
MIVRVSGNTTDSIELVTVCFHRNLRSPFTQKEQALSMQFVGDPRPMVHVRLFTAQRHREVRLIQARNGHLNFQSMNHDRCWLWIERSASPPISRTSGIKLLSKTQDNVCNRRLHFSRSVICHRGSGIDRRRSRCTASPGRKVVCISLSVFCHGLDGCEWMASEGSGPRNPRDGAQHS